MTPIEILIDEHRQILRVLEHLEEGADRLDSGDDIAAEFFLDAAEFVAGFADKCHHGKEEDILFVAMTARHSVRGNDSKRHATGFRTGSGHVA
jgi:hemerythrin-like domain-containing protein